MATTTNKNNGEADDHDHQNNQNQLQSSSGSGSNNNNKKQDEVVVTTTNNSNNNNNNMMMMMMMSSSRSTISTRSSSGGGSGGEGKVLLSWYDLSVVLQGAAAGAGRGGGNNIHNNSAAAAAAAGGGRIIRGGGSGGLAGGGRRRYLLRNSYGFAEPGSLLAIMGTSGCGKTTLLNSLAGRLGNNLVMENGSQILANGMKQQLSFGNLAFVTQDNSLITTLTVYETLMYSAQLQLPSSMSNYERQRRVHQSIQEMGLQNCVDTRVGEWHMRGLSGGEMRRLSIAIETIRQPSLFFLDEPTSGLDSAAALHVVRRLRTLAKGGRTIIVSIHQPSSEVLALFDYLCLLADGETVYFGDCSKTLQFYEDAGFPCPPFRNPSDHFLWVINSSFEEIKPHDVEMDGSAADVSSGANNIKILMKAYSESDTRKSVHSRIQQASKTKGEKLKSGNGGGSFLRKTYYLTCRSFTNMKRDLSYYWFRLLVFVLLSIALGTMYYRVGVGYTAIQARGAMLMFITSFLTFLALLSFPCFIEDLKIFTRERLNGHYGVASFVVANALSSLPFLALTALIPGSILYILGGLHPGLDRFFFFFINLLACLVGVESLLMAIASMVSDFLSGMIIGAGLMGAYLLTGGFFRLFGDIPKPIWRYPFSYISFNTWLNKAFYNNDFIGLEFENFVPGGPPIKGEDILRTTFQMDIHYSKWWLTVVLVFMAVVYRILFFVSMKLRERLPLITSNMRSGKSVKVAESVPSESLIDIVNEKMGAMETL